MNYPTEWDLNLNGDTFNALKSDFNMILRKTLTNMESKESDVAEITIKQKITLKKEKTPFGDGPPREIVVPKFDHKVSSVMQIKDELAGTLGGNYELVWDKERCEFVMREIVDGQQTIWDADYEVVETIHTANEEHSASVLPGAIPLMLPYEADGDSDAQYIRDKCIKNYPACICNSCKKNDGEICCDDHMRNCEDTTECIDFEEKLDDYEYEEPNRENVYE